jgi:protein-tyrosine phosphatase
MIDLHNHLLPGIDDGAKKVEETLEFLRLARQDGITAVTATPHMKPGVYDNSRELILDRVRMVREAARGDEAEGVELLPGAEVYFTADVVQRAKAGKLMTVGDRGRYILLELPYQQVPMGVDDTIFQLKLLGLTPIMAHPERVAYYLEDFERVAASVRLGALTQVTGNSITGRFGTKARDFSRRMLERGLIHVLASDSHDVRHRPPTLSDARQATARLAGEEIARQLVEDNPAAILAGKPVASMEPAEPASLPRGGFFRRLASMLAGRRG